MTTARSTLPPGRTLAWTALRVSGRARAVQRQRGRGRERGLRLEALAELPLRPWPARANCSAQAAVGRHGGAGAGHQAGAVPGACAGVEERGRDALTVRVWASGCGCKQQAACHPARPATPCRCACRAASGAARLLSRWCGSSGLCVWSRWPSQRSRCALAWGGAKAGTGRGAVGHWNLGEDAMCGSTRAVPPLPPAGRGLWRNQDRARALREGTALLRRAVHGALRASGDATSSALLSAMPGMLSNLARSPALTQPPPPPPAQVYNYWLENIKDWCISRQLWWGHRIPVWCAPGAWHAGRAGRGGAGRCQPLRQAAGSCVAPSSCAWLPLSPWRTLVLPPVPRRAGMCLIAPEAAAAAASSERYIVAKSEDEARERAEAQYGTGVVLKQVRVCWWWW